MKFLLFVTLLLKIRCQIECYNIDTHFPIIYNRTKKVETDRNSYFGFSVLLHKNWIIIGAPRANSTILHDSVIEPGVACRGGIREICNEIFLDSNENEVREENLKIVDLKNHAWIGGSMAMEHSENGKIVVCGHRWKNQAIQKTQLTELFKDKYAISGICYISGSEQYALKFHSEVPVETYTEEAIAKNRNTTPFIGIYRDSQIGSSVYIAAASKQNSISLLMGAPGTGRFWTGAVLEYMREPAGSEPVRRKRSIPSLGRYMKKGFATEMSFKNNLIKPFSYLGYQVAAGYFFSRKELYRVASAPRDDMTGSVIVYKVIYGTRIPEITHYEKLKGEKFGEYFGGSLAVADVTGDKLDDLIVGSPLFTISGDEGCIYLYTKNIKVKDLENQYFSQPKEKKIGFKVGGRFGTAVASLGDIDQDGFDDIAVGAPYENSGVVYIYNGMKDGLSSKFQRIEASDISPAINGFGISISRPADIDGNKFTDVAIGSYLSEHVVLLRSYPVIQLYSTIQSSVLQFNVNENSFTIRSCFFYNGVAPLPNIKVIRKIDIDVIFHRFKSVSPKSIELREINQPFCEVIKIEKKEEFDSKYNELNEITIIASQNLIHQEKKESKITWVGDPSAPAKGTDGFCETCPVVRESYSASISIPFLQDCGADGECKSDAVLHCELSQNGTYLNGISGYIIGSFSTLKLTVHVHNLEGDPLYYPKVVINIPREIELAQIPYSCTDIKGSSLSVVCGFGRINKGFTKSVNISLDLSAYEILRFMSDNGMPLTFEVNISRSNYEDLNLRNNKCIMNLSLSMVADVNITGKSVGDTFFSKNDAKETDIKHVYEVTNVGLSPIRYVPASISIPVEWEQYHSSIEFATPTIEAQQNGKSIFCIMKETNHRSGYSKSPHKGVLPEKNIYNGVDVSDKYPSNRTLYLNCSSSFVKCKIWYCNFMEFKASSIGKIIITPNLNFSKLASVMGDRDIIYFSTHGHVEMQESYKYQRPDIEMHYDAIVSSPVIGTMPKEKVQLWIIILCIIAGILLIAAIVIGLAKAGFFKRQKQEELMALKQSAE